MPKNEKIQYEVDPFNRLILSKTGRASRAPKFRHILNGKFKIGKNNTLTYQVKSPPPPAIPQQLKLSGDWSLDKEHNLVFTLDKENNQQAKDKLSLKGEIIDVKSDRLEFAVSAKDTASRMHFYILRLQGRWQADKYNRLSFLAEKEDGLYDILTLAGMWEINKENQISYTYIKTALKRREKLTRTLSFKGFWDVAKKKRILYALNKEINSGFDFKVSLGEPAKRGLKYEIGIGASPEKKRLAIFWLMEVK